MIWRNLSSIMMICGTCKCQVPDNSNYCTRCGAKIGRGLPSPYFSVPARLDFHDEQAIANLTKTLNLKLARTGNKTEIIGALTSAERNGADISQLVKIYRNFINISEKDAETCMITWVGQAYNKTAWQRAMAYAPYKEWIGTPGSQRTRDSHLKMNGVIIQVDEYFVVPGFADRYTHEYVPEALMMFPGDESQDPHQSQICRCRCTLVPGFRKKGK